jgi:hypothetical protein
MEFAVDITKKLEFVIEIGQNRSNMAGRQKAVAACCGSFGTKPQGGEQSRQNNTPRSRILRKSHIRTSVLNQ